MKAAGLQPQPRSRYRRRRKARFLPLHQRAAARSETCDCPTGAPGAPLCVLSLDSRTLYPPAPARFRRFRAHRPRRRPAIGAMRRWTTIAPISTSSPRCWMPTRRPESCDPLRWGRTIAFRWKRRQCRTQAHRLWRCEYCFRALKNPMTCKPPTRRPAPIRRSRRYAIAVHTEAAAGRRRARLAADLAQANVVASASGGVRSRPIVTKLRDGQYAAQAQTRDLQGNLRTASTASGPGQQLAQPYSSPMRPDCARSALGIPAVFWCGVYSGGLRRNWRGFCTVGRRWRVRLLPEQRVARRRSIGAQLATLWLETPAAHLRLEACGARRFPSSTGLPSRSSPRAACGRQIAPARSAEDYPSPCWRRRILRRAQLAALTGSFERIWYSEQQSPVSKLPQRGRSGGLIEG